MSAQQNPANPLNIMRKIQKPHKVQNFEPGGCPEFIFKIILNINMILFQFLIQATLTDPKQLSCLGLNIS